MKSRERRLGSARSCASFANPESGRALAGRRHALGSEDPDTMAATADLALDYFSGNLPKANRCCSKATRECWRGKTASASAIATTCNWLISGSSKLYKDGGKPQKGPNGKRTTRTVEFRRNHVSDLDCSPVANQHLTHDRACSPRPLRADSIVVNDGLALTFHFENRRRIVRRARWQAR